MHGTGEPSATEVLVENLLDLGFRVSVRTIRQWVRLGLIPAPLRRSLGRGRGMASEYPPETLDQAAAVASVMRRGLPWHLGVVTLVGRGHLPASEATLRAAFEEFFRLEYEQEEDDLERAERIARESRIAATTPMHRVLRAMDANFRRAKVRDPVTGQLIPSEEGVHTVLTHMMLLTFGSSTLTEQVGIEVAAAQGLLVNLPDELRDPVGKLVADLYNEVMSFSLLADVARRVRPSDLQRAVIEMRSFIGELMTEIRIPRLPSVFWDVGSVLIALAYFRMMEIGGPDAVFGRHRETILAIGASQGWQ